MSTGTDTAIQIGSERCTLKGILFKSEMIEAIQEGRKTQTRRVIKELEEPDEWSLIAVFDDKTLFRFGNEKADKDLMIKPRYQIGETVYIKEAWRIGCYTYKEEAEILYKSEASIGINDYHRLVDWNGWLEKNTKYGGSNVGDKKWRSPMFMPEWAARYFRKVKDVRAQRVQEITFEDSLAEGVVSSPYWGMDASIELDNRFNRWYETEGCNIPPDDYIDAGWTAYTRSSFSVLWDSINPKYTWELNPWEFTYTLEKVER